MLSVRLAVVGGDARPADVPLQLPAVIGRGRDVNVTLPHPLVSRRHCELFEENGILFVKDLNSLNGTFVNNLKINSTHAIKPGELLTLGNVTFRIIYEASEAHSDTQSIMMGMTEQAVVNHPVAGGVRSDVSKPTPRKQKPSQVPFIKKSAAEAGTPHPVASQPISGQSQDDSHSTPNPDINVADEDFDGQTVYQPSFVKALANVVDQPKQADVSLSAIGQLPAAEQAIVSPSEIDALGADFGQAAPRVGASFVGIDDDHTPSVAADDSALQAFLQTNRQKQKSSND